MSPLPLPVGPTCPAPCRGVPEGLQGADLFVLNASEGGVHAGEEASSWPLSSINGGLPGAGAWTRVTARCLLHTERPTRAVRGCPMRQGAIGLSGRHAGSQDRPWATVHTALRGQVMAHPGMPALGPRRTTMRRFRATNRESFGGAPLVVRPAAGPVHHGHAHPIEQVG